MGDGGVACVPSQHHIMEKFSICGGVGKSNGSNNSSSKFNSSSSSPSASSKFAKMKPKKQRRGGELGGKISGGGKDADSNGELGKDEVEEGELGTLPIEFTAEKPLLQKYEIKSEIEKGEFVGGEKWRKARESEKGAVSGKWRRGSEAEKIESGSWKPSNDELEKGEFIPDRWRKSEVVAKDDYSYRTRRRDSAKDRGWKGEREWTPPSSAKDKGWKCDREWSPHSSGKYTSEKEIIRGGGGQLLKRTSRHDSSIQERNHRISSKIVDEEGSFKNEFSNGKNHAREYSSGNRLKRYGADSDGSDRKHRSEYDDYSSSKSRKLSEDGSRTAPSSEHYSCRSVERAYRNPFSSSRNLSSDRYSSRHCDSALSSRTSYDRHNSSPHHSERSPRDRARHDHRDRSPGYRDRSPYDRSRHYDHSRSPYDRSRHYDHRHRSPSYSESSPQDQSRYHDHRDRTPSILERSPRNRPRPGSYREVSRKSLGSEKRESHDESKRLEEKPSQKDGGAKDQEISTNDSQYKSHLDGNDDTTNKTANHKDQKEELPQSPSKNAVEPPIENEVTEELVSMEEDMDICTTPPHVPAVVDATMGKWYYLDHLGVERGPSRLCELKTLVEGGFLVSDHLIKHSDNERWVTVENAVSPTVTTNFSSVVSDTVTQLASPPQAPGNLLEDNVDVGQHGHQPGDEMVSPPSDSILSSVNGLGGPEPLEDLHIDDRIGALLGGTTFIPGKELEIVNEVLQITFHHGEFEKWENIEGFTWKQSNLGEYNDQQPGDGFLLPSESTMKETPDSVSTVQATMEKDISSACDDISESFSGQWACKGGDWRRNDESAQDRSWKKKLVLNDGYPLCQMPKSGFEDPRWQRKDELYCPSQCKRLDLPAWAFNSPDEPKSAVVRGIRGLMLPVVRINTCVVKDHGSFVSEPRMKTRAKDRHSSRSSRSYSAAGDTKRSSEESISRVQNIQEQEACGSYTSNTSLSIPRDRLCMAEELQLHYGDWYYLDGAGHERGPFSFSELQLLADQDVIQKRSSAFRKVDKVWVPVTSAAEASEACGKSHQDSNSTTIHTSGASITESEDILLAPGSSLSCTFHDLHPQYIGYTRGKLHELIMKSYKSREFAAAINEVLDPWINARQPKKEMEKHIYSTAVFQKSDQYRGGKRARFDGYEEDYEMEEEISILQKDYCSFDDLCRDATFSEQCNSASEGDQGSWGLLNDRVLARVFHFLKSDTKSLLYASLTCKHWSSVVKFYKDISRQVDLVSLAPNCTDIMMLKIMNGYNKEKISSLVLHGCTGLTPIMLEEVLHSFPRLSTIGIRGCSQLEELASKFPNINWVRSHSQQLKVKSLKHITDKNSSFFKPYNGLDGQVDDSSGLRDYLERDKRDTANQLFRRSLYKRTKVFDARKSSSVLSRDAHLRRLAMRKFEASYKRMLQFLASSLKDIMKENTFDFFVPKVAEIEDRMRSGYYAKRGVKSVKEDISRMCRDAIKAKNRSDAGNMNRIISLFIHLAKSLDSGSKSSYERDWNMKSRKDESPPGFSSATSKYKKNVNSAAEKKYMYRSNGSSSVNSLSEYGDYASDREIKRRLSKLHVKSADSTSETSDSLDGSSDETVTESESTASETESDLDIRSQGGIRESRVESYFASDDGDSLADDREWGARMTKASLVPPVTRKYEVIDHYVVLADEEEVKRKMQVSLPEDYLEKLNAQRNGTEESDMEIPEVKDYKPRKRLGDEVIEQEVYGIDPYTHNLLLDSMPEESDWSLLDKHLFIEDVLLRTLNKQVRHYTGSGNTPMMYPLKPVFEEILDGAVESNNKRTVRLCQLILKAIDSRPEDNYVAYRKGLGVVCNKKGGFGEEDFVVEFLGEVYPAWKWFEKQDGIRSLQKNSNDPAPEFYNIYLERPKGDADGYDLVVVDAMHKANYASRICHSCRPNCEAKVTAVDGQYQIGIYSVRPIAYGEEITFDYNSVTESKEEYEASVCLCGSQVCRGSYLNLTGEGAYQKVLEEYHGLLDRHQLLLEACEVNSVSEEDYIDLGKAGLGSCLLGGLPDWLIAYSARLVRFINFERTKLPDEILKHNLEEKRKYFTDICLEVEKSDAEVQAEGVYNQRLQNLALTIDKVRYVMRCVFGDPKKAPPPIERLSPEEVVSFVWKGEGSLVEELIQSIAPHMEDGMVSDLKATIRAHDPSSSDNIMMELRRSLLWLRDEIRNLPCTYKCRHDAAADLVHIYAYTKCFFRIRAYKSVTSPPVHISPLDLCPKYAGKLGSGLHEYRKTYGESYCLGQLIYWHNQTNPDPDNSLARASRGCLSLPEVGSFYAKVQKPSRQRVYGPRTVKFMLSRMEKQPQRPWPKDRIWSFKSNPKVFCSPMLDAVLYKAPLDKEMVTWLKHRAPIFQAMWDR